MTVGSPDLAVSPPSKCREGIASMFMWPSTRSVTRQPSSRESVENVISIVKILGLLYYMLRCQFLRLVFYATGHRWQFRAAKHLRYTFFCEATLDHFCFTQELFWIGRRKQNMKKKTENVRKTEKKEK